MSADPIPVALFAYRRPDLLRQVVDALRATAVPKLIAFSDGPGSEDAEAEVAEVREILYGIDWCERRVIERPVNLGLGGSIRRGVSEVLAEHESVIVFEDDLVCVPGTYSYLAAALRHYRDDERVMSVTGWTHPRITPPGLGNLPYFDGKAECWVWGTWARAWHGMEMPAIEIMSQCAAAKIPIDRYGSDMPKMADEASRRNLWAVGWWYLHMLRGSLCLRPPWSLVETVGWDGRGVTILPSMQEWRNPELQAIPPVPIHWPEPVEHSACASLWRRAIDDL